MGIRGPVKGKGGRPAGSKTAKHKKATARKSSSSLPSDFVSQLADMTPEQFAALASQWRPLSLSDGVLLNVLWDAVQRYRHLTGQLESIEWVMVAESGHRQQVPEITMLNKCIDQIMHLSARFGMSPADRARLGDAPPDPKSSDPFGEHLSRIGRLGSEPTKHKPVSSRAVSGRSSQRKKTSRKK